MDFLENFKAFFTAAEGWGSLSQSREGQSQRNEIRICEGRLAVSKLALAAHLAPKRVTVQCGDKSVDCSFSFEDGVLAISLQQHTVVEAGHTLLIRLG